MRIFPRSPSSAAHPAATALGILLAATAQADAPKACAFLTPALVSAAVGRPVTGGTMCMADPAGANTSSCTYMAGSTFIVLLVDERGSAAIAPERLRGLMQAALSH